MKDHESKVYAGGIRNRINRVTMRNGGESTSSWNVSKNQTGVSNKAVISRTLRDGGIDDEPPTERSSQLVVKDNDV
jgi:hypothetical protein